MENALYTLQENTDHDQPTGQWLFPNRVKPFGMWVVLLTFLTATICRLTLGKTFFEEHKALLMSTGSVLLLVGFSLLIFAKEKVENRVAAIRRRNAWI